MCLRSTAVSMAMFRTMYAEVEHCMHKSKYNPLDSRYMLEIALSGVTAIYKKKKPFWNSKREWIKTSSSRIRRKASRHFEKRRLYIATGYSMVSVRNKREIKLDFRKRMSITLFYISYTQKKYSTMVSLTWNVPVENTDKRSEFERECANYAATRAREFKPMAEYLHGQAKFYILFMWNKRSSHWKRHV